MHWLYTDCFDTVVNVNDKSSVTSEQEKGVTCILDPFDALIFYRM